MDFCEYCISDLIPDGEIFSAAIGYDGLVYIIADEKAYAVHVELEYSEECGNNNP